MPPARPGAPNFHQQRPEVCGIVTVLKVGRFPLLEPPVGTSAPGPCAGAQSFLCVHPAVAQLHERGSCVSPAWTIDTAQLISFTLTLLSDFFSQ